MIIELSPYEHECHKPAGAGFDPEKDCPACRWAMDQALARMDAAPEVTWLEKLASLKDSRIWR